MSEEEQTLQCRECDEWFDKSFFHINRKYRRRNLGIHLFLKLRCKCCTQIRRDAAKTGALRFLKKAQNAINHHARGFVLSGKIKSLDELVGKYGWNAQVMAHEIEHHYSGNCRYCHRPYSGMPNGLQSIWLDILDPRKEPYYTVNVNWCCATCNKEKQDMGPEQWAAHLLNWERAEKARARKEKLDPFSGSLLEGLLGSGGVITV